MNKPAAWIASLAMLVAAPAAIAQLAGMRVNVFVVDSAADFKNWAQQLPAPQGPYPANLKEVASGRKVEFPILVSGLRPPALGSLALVAGIEFFAPDGKSIFSAPQCCRYTVTNSPDVATAVLGNAATLVLEPGDMSGLYTVRVSATDGTQTVASSETFQFVGGKPAAPAPPPASAVPALQMGTPPARNPGNDADKRDCLSLPTPAEVIKCTERK
jgi:hypothetical protein